jgi:hypothetical protein
MSAVRKDRELFGNLIECRLTLLVWCGPDAPIAMVLQRREDWSWESVARREAALWDGH